MMVLLRELRAQKKERVWPCDGGLIPSRFLCPDEPDDVIGFSYLASTLSGTGFDKAPLAHSMPPHSPPELDRTCRP